MGEGEISGNEEGALKVVQHYNLRFWLRRLRPEGFERHRVVKWLDSNCLFRSVQEATFNRLLMFSFLITLSLAVLGVIMVEQLLTHNRPPDDASTWDYIFDRTWLLGHFQIRRKGIVLLAIFAAVVAVAVFVKKTTTKNAGSAPPRRVQTISALVQEV